MRIAPADYLEARVARLRAALQHRSLDALLVTSLPNIAYLTGFFASAAALVVTPDSLLVIGDGRYASVLLGRAQDFPALTPTILDPGASYDEAIVSVLAPLAGLRVGFEAAHTSVHRHRSIAARLAYIKVSPRPAPLARPSTSLGATLTPSKGRSQGPFELIETEGLVEELRLRKDVWEVARLRDGAERLSDVAKCILPKALAGRTESEVAAEIERELRRVTFEKPAFDTIVASGPNAALPHGRASGRTIEAGDLVVMDFGGMLDGYCTDLTRTVVAVGHGAGNIALVAQRERSLIAHVIEAQQAAFDALKPGGQPEAADSAARAALDRHGLADAFTHGTGHGLGLEIHEGPRVTRARADRAEPTLAPGMVMTLEPGVYFPGWGGVRIEDDVLVTTGGAEWLTDVPRTF
jgi:Xaa-Pro aminopeptidase